VFGVWAFLLRQKGVIIRLKGLFMISSHYARVVFRELTQLGVPAARLLQATGFNEEHLWNAPKIDPEAFLIFLRNAKEQADGRPLAAIAGGKNRIAALGLMGMAMMSAPTLGDGLKAVASYSTLEAGYLRFPVVVGHAQSRVEFESEYDLQDCLAMHAEAAFLLFFDYISDIVGATKEQLFFTVTYADDGHQLFLPDSLHRNVRFSQPRNAVYFPSNWLTVRSPYWDDNTWILSQRLLSEQLQTQSQSDRRPFTRHIRYTLQAHQPPMPDIKQLAQSLHLSVRTLNRRLQDEGSHFRQLKIDAIHEGAKRMLLEGVSVEAIALAQGYENAANFRRSFRVSQGCSPKEWLVQHPASAVNLPSAALSSETAAE